MKNLKTKLLFGLAIIFFIAVVGYLKLATEEKEYGFKGERCADVFVTLDKNKFTPGTSYSIEAYIDGKRYALSFKEGNDYTLFFESFPSVIGETIRIPITATYTKKKTVVYDERLDFYHLPMRTIEVVETFNPIRKT